MRGRLWQVTLATYWCVSWAAQQFGGAIRQGWRTCKAWRQDRRLAVAMSRAAARSSGSTIAVFFSPKGGCTDAIVAAIRQATHTVRVQAYSFTSPIIAAELAAAIKRGVDVKVILDGEQQQSTYTQLAPLKQAGIEVLWDKKHLIAHNKVVIIDSQVVLTGSFNFTRSAESSNAENLLVINDAALAESYTKNWRAHQAHAVAA